MFYREKFIKLAKIGIVIMEIKVVVKKIEAAIFWLVLYASAIKIVDTADGVAASRTTADVSFGLKFNILQIKNINKGKINNFKIIEYLISWFKLKNLVLLFVIIPSLVPTTTTARKITILAGIHR